MINKVHPIGSGDVVYSVPTNPGVAPTNLEVVRDATLPACMGGPVLSDGDYVCLRWLGNCCWEINYRNQVVLLDNFYNRGKRAPETGVTAERVTRADAIIISHGHKDHISDTTQVALATGAPVYGHQTVADALIPQGLPAEQFHVFEDPEMNVIEFDGFKVTMIHTLHNFGGRDSSGFKPAILTYTAPSDAVLAEEEEISGRGSGDFGIMDNGLFSYFIEFESGFSIFASESNARGYAPGMQTFVDNLKKDVDVFFAPCQLGYNPIQDIYEKKVVDLIEAVRPHLVIPQHHDVFPDFPMTSVLPLFQWIYDNRSDVTGGYMQKYREPLIFDTVGQICDGPIAPLA